MKCLHLIIVLNIALSNQQILQRVENALTLLCRCTNCVLLHYRDCRSGEVKSVYVSSRSQKLESFMRNFVSLP